MKDLLVLDSNIVQIEDVGGSNPLCSTKKSWSVAAVSKASKSRDLTNCW
jgi:hypothetical protein